MSAKQLKKPRLVDERLVTALSHETRAHALAVFTERPASTKEIAGELKKSVSAVWFHVNKLRELDCIELVETKKRRGATEYFYRATVRHFFDAAAWKALPDRKRLGITMGVLRLIATDLDEAVQIGTADAIDRHLSRTLLILDKAGWAETTELLAETLERLLVIRETSATRRAETEEPIRASVSILQLELPSHADA